MIRKIIEIDEEKCNGCGACASACAEGAIGMVNGKAKLLRDDYCDGLGNCLPVCPTGAISFVEREAAEFDEAAVKAAQHKAGCPGAAERVLKHENNKGGCPGTADRVLKHEKAQGGFFGMHGGCPGAAERAVKRTANDSFDGEIPSELTGWPVQIKLAPVKSPQFDGADLLIAADCTAYAYGAFHRDFIKGRKIVIGCPKLDDTDYSGKLCEIIKNNDIKSVTLVRMEVPCCGGLEYAAKTAIDNSGKNIPLNVAVVSLDGKIIER